MRTTAAAIALIREEEGHAALRHIGSLHYESETEWRAPATGKTKEAVTSGTCCQRELRCPPPCPSTPARTV
jgi:hypothetical protein